MKKLMALIVALALVLSMTAASFAASGDSSSSTTITYTKEASEDPTDPEDPEDPEDPDQPANTYTISIPSSVALDSECNGSLTIAAESLDLEDSKQVVVKIDDYGFGYNNRWYVFKDGDDSTINDTDSDCRIPISFVYNKNVLTKGDTVGTFSADSNEASQITLKTSAYYYNSAAAGDYSGTLRFDISVEDK